MYHSGGDVDNGGGYGGSREVNRKSVPSTQFCCEPKTALKSKVYFLKWGFSKITK